MLFVHCFNIKIKFLPNKACLSLSKVLAHEKIQVSQLICTLLYILADQNASLMKGTDKI